MARHAILGNGTLTVGLDRYGLVHDFYFPYVGLENLTTSRNSHHKIGVWVDGTFSWTDDDSWDISVDFRDDALIAHVSLTHHKLGIHVRTEDFVHPYMNAFCRRLKVTSLRPGKRDVRIFMHQVFEISRKGRGDTAMYVPEDEYIFDYKGKICLVAAGADDRREMFDQYAVGNYGIEGKEGTFRDAEDGELSGSPVEHGGVDSVIRFRAQLDEGESYVFDYWVSAGESQKQAEASHLQLRRDGLQKHIDNAESYWRSWLKQSEPRLANLSPRQKSIARKSLLVIKAHIDNHGGVIASCDSSIYNYGRDYYSYVWPRDGAFAMWPLIRLGYREEPKKFFTFCKNILTSDGYLMHKYQPDGAVGSTWHPLVRDHHKELAIQEDETAIVIYMLYEFYRHSKDLDFIKAVYDDMVVPAANFMRDFLDEETGLPHASYDLWEEKFLTSTYTVSVVSAALSSAAALAKLLGDDDNHLTWKGAADKLTDGFSLLTHPDTDILRKGFLLQRDGSLGLDETLDISSLFGVAMFSMNEQTKSAMRKTYAAFKQTLLNKSPSGGLPRYEHDQYFASDPPYFGNPWFVSSLWFAQIALQEDDTELAESLMEWSLENTLPSGVLSEQIDPTTSQAKSVTPLVWSHAELINTLLDLSKEN